MFTIIDMPAPLGSPCRGGQKRSGLKGITIHETNNTNQGSDAKYMAMYLKEDGKGVKRSWHYVVDDKFIYRCIPEDEKAWHAGDGEDGEGNAETISIEICVNPESDFSSAVANAAILAADILARHHIRYAEGHLFQHSAWSGKNCPYNIRTGNKWSVFVQQVQSFMPKEKTFYHVRIGAFKSKAYAANLLRRMSFLGIPLSIVEENEVYKIQTREFKKKEEAQLFIEKLNRFKIEGQVFEKKRFEREGALS